MATTHERGYGTTHQTERDTWTRKLNAGEIVQCSCQRPDCPHHTGQCPTMITNDTDWDLGHNDDRTQWTGPECIPCNRSAGGRNAHQRMTVRDW